MSLTRGKARYRAGITTRYEWVGDAASNEWHRLQIAQAWSAWPVLFLAASADKAVYAIVRGQSPLTCDVYYCDVYYRSVTGTV